VLAKAELDAGYAVAWADLDAMGPAELLERLRALGVADEAIDERFLYFEPDEPLVSNRLAEVKTLLAEREIRLFVIDSFNPMLGLHGLDPFSSADVETFWRTVAAPIAAAGAAPVLIDHVPKNPDGRGKYAYGSERKASGAIVHLGFRPLEPFARGRTGVALITTHKDRPGFLPRPTIGRFVLASDGERVSYALEADRAHAGDAFRPTVLMERVSRALELEREPKTQRWIEDNVRGKKAAVRDAIKVLVAEGYLDVNETAKGHFYRSVAAYREEDDAVADGARGTASRPRPDRVPELRSASIRDRVPASPPTGDAVADAQTPRPRVPGRSGTQSLPAIGDEGYLDHLFAALEQGLVTEGEWRQGDRAHRFVVAAARAPARRLREPTLEEALRDPALFAEHVAPYATLVDDDTRVERATPEEEAELERLRKKFPEIAGGR
jgi:hypothetical protein